MNVSLNTKNKKGNHWLSLLTISLMCLTIFAQAQISIPGTGRTPMGSSDPNWHILGKWNTETDPDKILVYASGIRITDDDPHCIVSNDHTIYVTATAPEGHHGGATIYFTYVFYITQDGNYSTNDLFISPSSRRVDIAKHLPGLYERETVVWAMSSANACDPFSFSNVYLTAGEYELRIEGRVNTGDPDILTIRSAGGNSGNCFPAVAMTNSNSVTINSGGTINIPLTSSVPSTFTWQTNGNVNTSLNTLESGTTSPITKTITNLTGSPQTITYTVTPRSVGGGCNGTPQTITVTINPACTSGCDPIACSDCIGSFEPIRGATYVISAWVQQANSLQEMKYTGPALGLTYTGGGSEGPFFPSGAIIDGWQRIDTTFTVPNGSTEIFVRLINTGSNEAYFDDLRIQPLKASLKSFVYDPISMRLMAELDENNYATFYEYDEEGALIRVKKETERGIKTIKETGNNTRKNQ